MKIFLKKSFILFLLLFITSCFIYSDSRIHVSIENNIRSVGTYYIIDSTNIPDDLFNNIKEVLDENLATYGFIALKDKDSQQTANYLVTIDLQDKDSNSRNLKITILDNTSSNLKNVFLGSIIFKKSNLYGSKIILTCGINSLFVTSTLSKDNKNFFDIKNHNNNQDCKEFM